MPKLVNLGSLGIDHVYGVERIAQAGETVSSETHHVFPGGKGSNQSIAAARAGADVIHVGRIGADGDMLIKVLSNAGVAVSGIRTSQEPTQHAVIQVDNEGRNAIVIFGGANRTLTQEDRDFAFSQIESGDWLLLQNEVNDVDIILEQAAAHNVPVAFNVAPADGREQNYDLKNVNLLIVNEIEAAAIVHEDAPQRAFDTLIERYPDTVVVLTLGKEGGWYGGAGEPRKSYKAHKVNAVDETAAGDSFIGYFMAEWLKNQSLEKAIMDANAAGAIAVTKRGAASAIPTRAQVDEFKRQI